MSGWKEYNNGLQQYQDGVNQFEQGIAGIPEQRRQSCTGLNLIANKQTCGQAASQAEVAAAVDGAEQLIEADEASEGRRKYEQTRRIQQQQTESRRK